MKIISYGQQNPNKWKEKYVCTGKGWDQDGKTPCGALLEVEAQDIRKRYHVDMSGERDTYYGFTCPVCGCFTEVNRYSLTTEVITNAREYGWERMHLYDR